MHIFLILCSQVKISNCNFYSSTIVGIRNYDDLLCKSADFSMSNIDSKELTEYLRNNGAANVPENIINEKR